MAIWESRSIKTPLLSINWNFAILAIVTAQTVNKEHSGWRQKTIVSQPFLHTNANSYGTRVCVCLCVCKGRGRAFEADRNVSITNVIDEK